MYGRTALSSEQSAALLATARRGRLITTLGALPVAEPVPFVAQGRQVVVRVVEPDPIRDGDVLSLQVDDIDERTGAGWSVLVTGSARRIGPDHRLMEALRARATEDWLDTSGQLILLGDPLVRGVTIDRPAPAPPAQRPSGHAAEALRAAVSLAARAPSVHGPGRRRWRSGPAGLDLFATGHPAGPEARALLFSCGASLQHARVALVAAGWAVRTLEFPDPDDPDHVAGLRLLGRVPPHDDDLRLVDAAARRPTGAGAGAGTGAGTRVVGAQRVPGDALAELVVAARFEDTALHPVAAGVEWLRVSSLLDDASGPAGPATPAARDFAVAAQGVFRADLVEHPVLAVLCTAGDDRGDWLRAGAAMAAVALVAEARGLACTVVAVPEEARTALRGLLPSTSSAAFAEVNLGSRPAEPAGALVEPQLLFRIGVPAAEPVTSRVRLPLREDFSREIRTRNRSHSGFPQNPGVRAAERWGDPGPRAWPGGDRGPRGWVGSGGD